MTQKELNVLWIVPGFAADEQDYNCIPPLQDLARELSMAGVTLFILALDYPYHTNPYLWHGIPVQSANKRNRRWGRVWYWRRLIHYANKIQQERRITSIHSFWLGPCWLIGHYLARKWAIPHRTTLMGQDVLPSNPYLKLSRYLGHNYLVALSAFHQKILAESGGKADIIIPWGLPASFPQFHNQKKTIDILGCGSLITLKNWTLWLEVVTELCAKYPHLRTELIGAGPERETIIKHIISSGLENQVILRGELPRQGVWQKMAETKILLHTSTFESYGMVLAEAYALGCHVVSTPVGIVPEMARCGNTKDELVEIINEILIHPQLKKFYPPFSIQNTAGKYLQLYQEKIPLL